MMMAKVVAKMKVYQSAVKIFCGCFLKISCAALWDTKWIRCILIGGCGLGCSCQIALSDSWQHLNFCLIILSQMILSQISLMRTTRTCILYLSPLRSVVGHGQHFCLGNDRPAIPSW